MGYWTFNNGMTSKDETAIAGYLLDNGVLFEDFIQYMKDRYSRDDVIDEIVNRDGDLKSWYEDIKEDFIIDWAEANLVEGEDATHGIKWHDGEEPE